MTMTLIATTQSRDMQPLGVGGQRVIDSAGSISAVLTRSLSPAHAALFAEPESDAARGEIDWYADVTGAVTALSELPEIEQSRIKGELDRLTIDINALAEKLAASSDVHKRRIGELLALALSVPSRNCIKTVNGRPILVGWGHKATDSRTLSVAVQGVASLTKIQSPGSGMEIFPAPVFRRDRQQACKVGFFTIDWRVLGLALLLFICGLGLLDHDIALLGENQVCRIDVGDLAGLAHWRQSEQQTAVLNAKLARLIAQVSKARCNCALPANAQTPPIPGTGA